MSELLLSKRKLLAGAAVAAMGTVLASCTGGDDTESASAKPEADPGIDTSIKTAATGNAPEAQGSVEVAKLMENGPLPEMSVGDENAPVTIVEYMSMTCPHCARFHHETYPGIKEKYVDTGKVRFILREFPLDQLAAAAIMLARCAPEDQYFPFVSVLFEQQVSWATAQDKRAALLQMAKLAGFTQESFEACLTNQKLLDDVSAVRSRAADDYGVNSTPTFFINGDKYSGEISVDDMSAIIDSKL